MATKYHLIRRRMQYAISPRIRGRHRGLNHDWMCLLKSEGDGFFLVSLRVK